MSWVRMDDGAREHRKQLKAGAEACWLWSCGLMYAGRQKAHDGFIPSEMLTQLYPFRKPLDLAAKLVEVGLWDKVEGGYHIHDYNEYQPTAEEVAALAAKRANAGKLGGSKSGATRRSKGEATPPVDVEANAKQVASTMSKHIPSHPIPVRISSEARPPLDDWACRNELSRVGVKMGMGPSDEGEWVAILDSLPAQGFSFRDFQSLALCIEANEATWPVAG